MRACSFQALAYNADMKVSAIIFVLFLLAACGPKEIGQDTSGDYERPAGGHYGAAEQMRQPFTGVNNTEKMLYYYNRPEIMENIRNWRADQFRRQTGVSPEDPAYREQPRQRSPFRQ